MERKGGNRRKTRAKFKKTFRQKGKISISKFFQEFKPGDKVTLSVEPGVQQGLYHRKFIGKSGKILERVGKSYNVEIKDFKSTKNILVRPVHLKRY